MNGAWIAVAAAGAAVVAVPWVGPIYHVLLMLPFMAYGVVLLGLSLLFGYTGLVSFGHAAFFGLGAGTFNTTGDSNSFFGRFTGESNTTGFGNSFFGRTAGFSNTTGGSNSFFGRSAGFSNTTGGDNSFFGQRAGASNSTGFCSPHAAIPGGCDQCRAREKWLANSHGASHSDRQRAKTCRIHGIGRRHSPRKRGWIAPVSPPLGRRLPPRR